MSTFTIITLFCEVLLALGVPLLIYGYFRKPLHISLKPVLIGAVIWFFFTQVLEKGIHFVVINTTTITHIPWLFALYGSIMAGIFEECGRFFALRKLLPLNKQWNDGIAYGIGHGGIESIVIGGVSGAQLLAFAFIINDGNIPLLKQILPHTQFIQIMNTLYNSPILFIIGGFERVCALAIQIALSLLVLLAVKKKKGSLFLYAIGIHILADLAPAFYQTKIINVWITELLVACFAIGSVIWIKKAERLFH